MPTPHDQPGHHPVLPAEVVSWLDPHPDDVGLDGTVGLGGHARLLGERLGAGGLLIGLDRDQMALARATENLQHLSCKVILRHSCYSRAGEVLDQLGVAGLDFALLDLGVSSLQLDLPERGFSFRYDAPLDMRMDQTAGETAADYLARVEEKDLADAIYIYGEERFSRRIAKRIVEHRRQGPINTTGALAELVGSCVPGRGRIHPATRTFQALRIVVNDELGELTRGLAELWRRMRPGGRLGVISFHSLEDRLVKRAFMDLRVAGEAEPRPKKSIKPAYGECQINRRARSAKLRICRKCR